MKKNQEKHLLDGQQTLLFELLHSVSWPAKIDESLFSELTDEANRLSAIQRIEDELLIKYESLNPKELIHEIATLTWGCKFLEHVAKSMADKIERERESNLRLIDHSLIYENIKLSNRKSGASASNERHETELKKIAKEKWLKHRESGKPCGSATLIKLLYGVPGVMELSEDTAKGWTQQWNKEFKKG